jgi:hypothetical protein
VARRVTLLVLLAALTTFAGTADARASVTLERYLASMSWPMRGSVLRARTLSNAIDDWIAHGEPPYLGGIAENCKHFLAVEPRGRVLAVVAPARLGRAHGALVQAYSAVRAACTRVRRTAVATRDAGRSPTAARAEFRRFQRTTLQSFSRAVAAWGTAFVRELRAAGLAVPGWLIELG